MKRIVQTRQFSRDVRRLRKRGQDLHKLQNLIRLLAADSPLPPIHNDYPLIGLWRASRDCHIEPDWILIYTAEKDALRLERTGTHSDLFK